TVDESTLPVAVPDKAEGEYTVGSLNLYRLFQSESDYATRLSKFSMYIRNILNAPDILAVQEVENLGALEDLAAKILLDDGSVMYNAFLEEGNDIGGIDVGFLVRSDRVQVDAVTQLGATETYVDPSDSSVDILHDRPPLLLEGSFIVGPTTFYSIAVMAVHNRSLNDIETLRVQTKRLTQAQSIAEKVQALQDADPEVHLVVTGDFNAFEFTDGYVDAVGHIAGDFDPTESVLSGADLVEPNLTNQVLGLLSEDRYSFVYQGNAQVLDHALTSIGLNPAITGFAYGRGNSDAAVIHINDGGTALRSSDHDGLVLFVDATPPEIIFNDPINLWPVNHKYTTFEISDIVSAVKEDGEDLPIESVYIQKVTSDEPDDADGNGDGKTVDDIVIVDCQTVKLRAEREGTGNGRVYTVYLAVENANGYIGYGTYQIGVPHDKKDTAIDDGTVYEVLSDCETQDGLGKILDNSGTENVSDINAIPNDFALNQNYPNPFNPITTINYQLPEPSNVVITIYDISGRKVRELITGFETAGFKSVNWNGRDNYGQIVSGGIYIYHLKAGTYSSSKKMLLMK
ncbi:T9SS type A sorting domain-containing protein, partial [Candidatus Neomarinimicrobiota bacterium]